MGELGTRIVRDVLFAMISLISSIDGVGLVRVREFVCASGNGHAALQANWRGT